MQPAEYVTDATTRFLALSLLGFWLGAAILGPLIFPGSR